MAQVKIYGLKDALSTHRVALSKAIHNALIEVLKLPVDKKFQRFVSLNADEMIYPDDRSNQYTIIEISMFEGRSVDVKKALIRALFHNIHEETGIAAQDIEITITESPKSNWGIRGLCGDELQLNYPTQL